MKRYSLENLTITLTGFRQDADPVSDRTVIDLLVKRVAHLTGLLIESGAVEQCNRCGELHRKGSNAICNIAGEPMCARCAQAAFEEMDEELYPGAVHQVAAFVAVRDYTVAGPQWTRMRRDWIINGAVKARIAQIKRKASQNELRFSRPHMPNARKSNYAIIPIIPMRRSLPKSARSLPQRP